MPVDFLKWIDDEIFAYQHCDDSGLVAVSAINANELKVIGTILIDWYFDD